MTITVELCERIAECIRQIQGVKRCFELPPTVAPNDIEAPLAYIVPQDVANALPFGQAGAQIVTRNFQVVFLIAELTSSLGIDDGDKGVTAARTALNICDRAIRYFLDNPRLQVRSNGVLLQDAFAKLSGDVSITATGLLTTNYAERDFLGFNLNMAVAYRLITDQVN